MVNGGIVDQPTFFKLDEGNGKKKSCQTGSWSPFNIEFEKSGGSRFAGFLHISRP